MPRSQFDQELNKMHVDLDRMCHLVVLAIDQYLRFAFRDIGCKLNPLKFEEGYIIYIVDKEE